jgi:CHAD domain-containing protein
MDIARNLVDAARNLTTSSPDPDRAFRLRLDERVPDGIRRIARGQLHDAHEELDGTPSRRLGEAVHATRKRFKRLRATVRLARDAIGEPTYDRENTALRMAGRRISAPRDAQMLLATLDTLTERFADELPASATSALRDRLERDRRIATTALTDTGGDIDATRAAIAGALARTPAWTFERDGFDAIRPGLKRIYRRGRQSMRAAREDPTPENLHEWRKRTKDLWHATQIVGDARPERLDGFAKRAHKLADLLGDGHDLELLREYVEAHPQTVSHEPSRKALLAIIDRRSDKLRGKALKRGAKLYRRKPGTFVERIERGWRKRAAAPTARRSASGG